MKKLAFITLLFFSMNVMADCNPAVVAIMPLKINTLASFTDDIREEIEKTKKMRDEENEDIQYKHALKSEIEWQKNRLKDFLKYEDKYYVSYSKLRSLLLESFSGNMDEIMQKMKDSDGIKLQRSRLGGGPGQSDYALFCHYTPTMMPPDNRHWEKFRGFFSCKLIDVEKNLILWISDPYKNVTELGHYSTPAEEMFPKAWNQILENVPKTSELEKIIKKELDYKSAKLTYEYDDEEKKEANAKEKGDISISNISETIEWGNPRPRNIAEFTIKAKQGNFEKTGKHTLEFIPREYRENSVNGELPYKYITYDCNEKNIKDKLFETFTLERTCFLGKKDSTIMAELKVPFECEEYFYTATLNKKTTRKAKVLKSYRGMSKSLKNVLEDHEKFYIYVDVAKDKVVQHFVEDESYRKKHREKYELNMQTCQYSIDVKDTKTKKQGARALLRSDDMGWGIEDETKFYVKLPHTSKRVSFTWKHLKDHGRINKTISYSYGIFDLPKDLANNAELKKGAKMAEEETKKLGTNSADYIRETENNQDVKKFQKFVTHPLTPRDIQCGIDVSIESMMMQPLDGTLDPKVNVKVNIRKSTKAEIAIMKASMKKGN